MIHSSIGTEPASAVIREVLRHQHGAPPRTRSDRFFGRNPLTQDALPWYRGAQGEIATARALADLGPEWLVLHAMPVGSRGADVDHVVIGPAGVITINAKRHHGAKVWVGASRLLVNGHKTDHLRNSRYEASRVAHEIEMVCGFEAPVRAAIVVVDAATITVKQRPADVDVTTPSGIVGTIVKLPTGVTAEQLATLRAWASAPRRWADAVILTPEERTSFAALAAEVQGAVRIRRVWLAAALVAIAAAAIGAATLSGALSALLTAIG